MIELFGSLVGLLSLLQGQPENKAPIFVDERAEIPWIVAAAPGSRCGSSRVAEGPRSTRDRLVASLRKPGESSPSTSTSPTPTTRLRLLPSAALLGAQGEVLVVAVETLLARRGVRGAVHLHVHDDGAWLELPALDAEAAAALAGASFSPAELRSFEESAAARLARRRATIGSSAKEKALRWSCFAVVDDPALPLDLGRRLRAQLAVLRPDDG